MKLTKTIALSALIAGGLLAANSALQAQDTPKTPTPPPVGAPGAPGVRGGPGLSIDLIAKQLDLTEDQKPKVKTILDDMRQKMRDLRNDASVAAEDKRAKMKEIRDAITVKLKEVLTAEQFAKWQKMGGGARPRPASAPVAPADKPAEK